MGQLPKKVGGGQKAVTTKHKTTTERGYGSEWRKLRTIALARYAGLCGYCRQHWAEHVHHCDHDTSNNDISNLLPVCRQCHQRIHNEE